MTIEIQPGFTSTERPEVAALYWQAFGGKLGRVMGPDDKAIAFIEHVARSDHAISARDAHGRLVGLAGYKTYEGAFVGGGLGDLTYIYGAMGALWRAAILALLERDIENTRFLMDGVFVRADARGQGVGTALVEAICDEARTRGYAEVRLDVVNENVKARALYERLGFEARGTDRSRIMSALFGFRAATTMVRAV